MLLGYHLSFGAYGFWLPNDPRGSWSDYVRRWGLLRHGNATKTTARCSVARRPHDHRQRMEAKAALRHPPVRFTGRQAQQIAAGLAVAVEESCYRVFGCAIMPDHVHLVVAAHRRSPGRIIGHFKARATQRLLASGLWPDSARPVWADRGRKVFLYTDEELRRAVRYVQQNPVKDKLPAQRWSFVVPVGGPRAPGKPGR